MTNQPNPPAELRAVDTDSIRKYIAGYNTYTQKGGQLPPKQSIAPYIMLILAIKMPELKTCSATRTIEILTTMAKPKSMGQMYHSKVLLKHY